MPPRFLVRGGRPLRGTVRPAGNKNAALPILAATLLADGVVELDNIPRIRDVETMLAVLQDLGATPDWVGPAVAISQVVIAVTVVGTAAVLIYTALRIVGETRKVSTMIQGHQEDVAQALAGARRLADQGQDLLVLIRQEIGAFTQTSRRIRRKLVRGVDNIEAKLADLETLYDLVHEEVEDTALDVAAALRTSREGNGMLGRVRRMIVPSRR